MIFLSIFAAATITLSDLREEFKPNRHDSKIVDDAMSRWRLRSGDRGDPMRGRFIIVFYTLHERCVSLRLQLPALGGDPVYCYNRDSDKFVSAYDQFE